MPSLHSSRSAAVELDSIVVSGKKREIGFNPFFPAKLLIYAMKLVLLVNEPPLFNFFNFISRHNRILSRKQIHTYIGRVGPKETDYSA